MKQLLLVAGIGFGMVALAYTSQPSGSTSEVQELIMTDTVPQKDTTKKKGKKQGKTDTLRRDTSRWPTDTSRVR